MNIFQEKKVTKIKINAYKNYHPESGNENAECEVCNKFLATFVSHSVTSIETNINKTFYCFECENNVGISFMVISGVIRRKKGGLVGGVSLTKSYSRYCKECSNGSNRISSVAFVCVFHLSTI